MSDIEQTLEERGARYGRFDEQAVLAQCIKNILSAHASLWRLHQANHVMREALDMIASKLARIACGDPTYKDNWHDIIGYCTLVLRELETYDD